MSNITNQQIKNDILLLYDNAQIKDNIIALYDNNLPASSSITDNNLLLTQNNNLLSQIATNNNLLASQNNLYNSQVSFDNNLLASQITNNNNLLSSQNNLYNSQVTNNISLLSSQNNLYNSQVTTYTGLLLSQNNLYNSLSLSIPSAISSKYVSSATPQMYNQYIAKISIITAWYDMDKVVFLNQTSPNVVSVENQIPSSTSTVLKNFNSTLTQNKYLYNTSLSVLTFSKNTSGAYNYNNTIKTTDSINVNSIMFVMKTTNEGLGYLLSFPSLSSCDITFRNVNNNTTVNAGDINMNGTIYINGFNVTTYSSLNTTDATVIYTTTTTTTKSVITQQININSLYNIIYINLATNTTITQLPWSTQVGLGNVCKSGDNNRERQFLGDIGDLIYLSSSDETTRVNLEGCLAWKWGLQSKLPTTHKYYNYSPI